MGRNTKRLVVIAAVGAVAISGGAAWAAWVTSGSGEGSAKAGQAKALVATKATIADGALVPGGKANVEFTVKNENAYKVKVTDVVVGGAITSDKAGCDGTNVTFPAYTTDFEVPASQTSFAVTLVDAVTMIADANNACQGATFTIPLTLTGESAA